MIKNLLFDLGGVIMDIRRENAVEALKKIGMDDADSFLGEYAQKGPFLLLEEGQITADDFYAEIKRHICEYVSDAQIREAFCKFLVGIPEHRLDSLVELKNRGFRIFMLSNTNPIMWNSEIDRQFRKKGKDINFYFDGIVTSFEAKCCKPDERIFRSVLDRFGINAAETIFFDDSRVNTEAAEKLGFRTHLVEPGKEFIDFLNNIS